MTFQYKQVFVDDAATIAGPYEAEGPLKAIPALVIEWANPVIGIIKPHLQKVTHLSKNPSAVNRLATKINVTNIKVVASLVAISKKFA